MEKQNKTALILGASGLVGSFLIQKLLDAPEYSRVISVGRRSLPIPGYPEKLLQISYDFEQLSEVKHLLSADDVYCCLGTTMKKAGSKEAFRKVDLEYPMALAQEVLQNGEVQQFFLVSAMGANASSAIFYNRIKGELEEKLKELNFSSLHIFRPAILTGPRKEKRRGESLGITLFKWIDPLLIGPLKNYRYIEANSVAEAMLKAAQKNRKGLHIYTSHQIKIEAA